jgi:hypothetical protein
MEREQERGGRNKRGKDSKREGKEGNGRDRGLGRKEKEGYQPPGTKILHAAYTIQ